MRKILIVDDDPNVADVIEQYFESPEYDVCTMLEGEKVPETVSRIKPDLILLDLKLPDVNGMDVLKNLRNVGFQTPVVIITGNVSAGVAMEAMKEGAYDYLPKPFSLDELGKLVDKLLEKSIHFQTTSFPEDRRYGSQKTEELVGRSPEILKIGKMIGQVASSEAPIFLTGERGTGKEFIAKIIHQNSRRKDKPFVAVNCAYPSPEMLEMELFGRSDHPGSLSASKFQLCNGGTLFLDDIEGMSLSNQNRLLRAMKIKEIIVQGNKTLRLDLRMIAASSRDLSERMRQGEFMQELLYNLRVISIHLPPLRERNSDIPLFAEHFLKTYCRQTDKVIPHVSADAMKLLMSYFWPGNVGELENNIHSAVVMCKGDQILDEHLPIHFQGNLRTQLSFQKGGNDYPGFLMQTLGPVANKLFRDLKGKVHAQLVEALEKALISLALNRYQGNQVRAADILGISRNTLRERMLKFGLSKKEKAQYITSSNR